MLHVRFLLASLITSLLAAPLLAQVDPGSLLVSVGEQLRTYTPDGMLISSEPIPYPGGAPVTEGARDIVRAENGDIHVFNGTFSPFLSTRRSATGLWEHHTHPGWATVNNVSYGGVGVSGPYVFVTDNLSAGGLVRFDQDQSFASVGFAQPLGGFIDLTVGRDGLLHALSNNETRVRTFDPETLELIRTTTLGAGVRGIAVDTAGQIFGASWDGSIYHFDINGNTLVSLNGGVGSLMDIDLDPFGNLSIGTRLGGVLFGDVSLRNVTQFSAPFNTFAAFDAPAGPGIAYCESLPNSTGAPAGISASGSESISAANLTMIATSLPNDTFYIFYVGTGEASAPFGNGITCVGSGMLRFPVQVAMGGIGTLEVLPTAGLNAGTLARFQCWFRDPAAGGAAFNTSAAYAVQLVP